MKCARCQHENRPGAKFCEECAAPLERVCANCGAPLSVTAKFCSECAHPAGRDAQAASPRFGAPEVYTPKHLAEKILTSKAALEGERKQVTVLFADLKGSMELLADRDPEEARKLLDPVLERMMEAVHRYEGTVNQVMGDGIMALFGAPLAHEDHAVRACYAALWIQESLKRYADDTRRSHGVEVQIRVGLNSGEVVVRSVGSDLRMDYTAVGQTTHLAARMEQLAPPGTVRLTGETVRLAEGYVEVKSLGLIPVKGLPDPIEIFELTGAGTARTRLQAAALRGLTRFVGRDAEVEHLRRVLGQAGAGHGQVVAIVGQAGVGKSRLTYEFTHSHRVQDWLILESSSVSYGKATSYLPVIDLLKGYFKIGDRDDHREMRAKVLGRVLGLDRALEPLLPPLLALLDVPVEDPAWQNLDPPQRRQRTLDAVKRLLLRESQVQPLLVVFEDLHWIDGETQALLDGLVESLGAARILLLVNYRPEYEHRWGSKTAYSQLRLDSLSAESTAELLAVLLGPDPRLAPLTQMLVKRGNPFFLEETVRTLVESGALAGERGAYRLTRPVEALQVPATVQTILAARIDRLPAEEKRLLQAASVIGKHVPDALLAAIAEQPEEALRRGLAHLREAEFLYETQLFPDLEFTFKHALTHDVAYAGLLVERRRELHAAVVTAIERLHGGRLVEHVERLAHHARQGEVWDKAVRYLRQAGAKVFMRSANREAATCFEQALDALRRLPEHPDAIAESLDIRFDLRNALLLLGEGGRIGTLLDEAEALAEAAGDQRRLGLALNYKVIQFSLTGDLAAALQAGRRALVIGESLADVAIQVVANGYLGGVHVGQGEYGEAVRYCETALALIPAGLEQERFGQAAIQGSFVRSRLARALGPLGRFAEAFGHLREAIQIAEEAGHVYTLVFPLFSFGTLKLDQGDFAGAVTPLERGLDLCRTREVPLLLHDFAGALGAAYHGIGRRAEGVALMEDAARGLAERTVRLVAGWPGRVGALGAAYLLDSRLVDATRIAQDGLAAARQRGERGVEGHAVRLLGDIAAHPERFEVDAAEAHYRQALALAEELGLRPLMAHCHLGLGALHRRTGKREQAREHTMTARTMFGEMDMLYWREQAEMVMTELA
ncbi:MAG TPA: adenylate/guanylate cyclase domain-containing protein [Methylomirabilota bacterium]|nr:adenylate/guanylate cyclase domain-containing protein [Methylomirabilota bacterium]